MASHRALAASGARFQAAFSLSALRPAPLSKALRPVAQGGRLPKQVRMAWSRGTATTPAPVADNASVDEQADGGAEEVEIPPEVAELFDTLRDEALRRLDEFGPIHLFSLCWAYSTARLLDDNLQQRITDAALRLGEARDNKPAGKGKGKGKGKEKGKGKGSDTIAMDASGGDNGGPHESSAEGAVGEPDHPSSERVRRPSERFRRIEQPSVLAEGEHWMALFKPPYWQVNVDAKEATKAAERNAAVTPFADDDDEGGDDEDQQAYFEEQARKLKLDAWVRRQFSSQHPIYTDPIEAHGLLHRLDAQTSGIIMCAKSYVGAYWLRLQWCSYMVDKEYVCLVHGWVPRDLREIHKRIRVDKKKAPNSRRTISTHCTVGANGKPSFTEVHTLAHLQKPALGQFERYSLVALKLHTGRTHQIRVHMQSEGHPLVTDSKYGEDKHADDQLWCPRNFLHTYHVGFDDVPAKSSDESGGDTWSSQGSPVELFCPLPTDLRDVLRTLRPVDDASAGPYHDWLSGDSRI